MPGEQLSPLFPCRDAMRLDVQVVKLHGPAYQAVYSRMKFSVAAQLQNGKSGSLRTKASAAQKVESWLEVSWSERLSFDDVSWLSEQKTLPMLRFKLHGHKQGDGSRKTATLWSAALSCAPFFLYPNQTATLMLSRQTANSQVDSTNFGPVSLQVEIRAVPLNTVAEPNAIMLAPENKSPGSLLNFGTDSLFVSVKGIRKLQYEAVADQTLQTQVELRVGSHGPFQTSKLARVKKSNRSVNIAESFLLRYNQHVPGFTPVLIVNVNIFVGSPQHNVTIGSFCVELPLFAFLLADQHVVADWFPLHRNNSHTGNVKGYISLEIQHCPHSALTQSKIQGPGIALRIADASQINLLPCLGESSLFIEASASEFGGDAASGSHRTSSRAPRRGSVTWNEILFLPIPQLEELENVAIQLRLCNENRFDDMDCHVGVATAQIDLRRHRQQQNSSGENRTHAVFDAVIFDSSQTSRGSLRCELIGVSGPSTQLSDQFPDEPVTRAAQHRGFDAALYLRVEGLRYLQQFEKHASIIVRPQYSNAGSSMAIRSSPMMHGGGHSGVLHTDRVSHVQVKEVPLRRGSFVVLPVSSRQLPPMVTVHIVEHRQLMEPDHDLTGSEVDHAQVAVRKVTLPLQWFMTNTANAPASADWSMLSGTTEGEAIPPTGWGQLQLSGAYVPSAAGTLSIKVLRADSLPQRSMVENEDVFVRLDVGKRTLKSGLSVQAGSCAEWDEVLRLQYSLWTDDFLCKFSLLRDTNLQDNFLGERSLPVHILTGKGGAKVGQTIYGEHLLRLHNAGSNTPRQEHTFSAQPRLPTLRIRSTFVPVKPGDVFDSEELAAAADMFALKRLFYDHDPQRALIVNRAQLCQAAANLGSQSIPLGDLDALSEQDKMISWSEWNRFLTSRNTGNSQALVQQESPARKAAPHQQQDERHTVLSTLASDPALKSGNNRTVNILVAELHRLRQELDQRDKRIQDLEAAGGHGGGGAPSSKFDFVRAGANNLRHMKARKHSKGSNRGSTHRSTRNKKKSKSESSPQSDAIRKLQKQNNALKTQLHLEKTRSLATDSAMVDHRINQDANHMIKLMQHDHRLQVQSLETTNAELKRKLDRREQKYQRVLASQKMMEQKMLQKHRKVQDLEREMELLRVQLQSNTWRSGAAGADAQTARSTEVPSDLERSVRARLEERSRRKNRSAAEEAGAASLIQGRYRNHRAKQEQQRHASATKIQARYRAHRYRKAGAVGGFEIGTRVLANFKGKAMRFGTITGHTAKGGADMYTVQYDHGPLEKNVPGEWIKAIGEDEDPRAAELKGAGNDNDDYGDADDFVGGVAAASWTPEIGDFVEVAGMSPPTIAEVVSKNETGEQLEVAVLEELTPRKDRTMSVASSDVTPYKHSYAEGDRIVARYQASQQWFEGVVTQECGRGLYNILYDDGNREFDVACVFMKPAPQRQSVDIRTLLAPGLVVEARYGGGAEWYRGTVQTVRGARGQEECDIKYDDGDVEEGVPVVLMRIPNDGADGFGPDGPGQDGDTAEDRDNNNLLTRLYRGLNDDEIKALLRTPWNSPQEKREVLKTIAMLPVKQKKAVCRLFMSEDSESRANRLEYVREFVKQQSELRRQERAARKIQKGVRTRRKSLALSRASLAARREAAAIMVQRNYRNARNYKKCAYKQSKESALKIQRYYRARAARQSASQEPSHGKSEAELNTELLEAINEGQGVDVCESIIMANADVNATGLGDDAITHLYAATVVAARHKGDETQAGTTALTVVSMLLEFKASPNVTVGNGNAPIHVAAELGSDDAIKVLMRDAAPDARVAAMVAAHAFQHRNADTTESIGCDINIVNPKTNKTALALAASNNHEDVIRLLLDAGGKIDDSTPAFHNGDTVEARYQAGDHYFPGRIQSAYIDNTFDILYDDGDTEKRVPHDFIRSYSPSDNEDDTFLVGDAVLANYKGDGQWYRGHVRHVNKPQNRKPSEITYDIEFTDGTIQKKIEADCVKEAPSSAITFEVGNLVSALYRQGTKYFDGMIADVHDDGTYLIEYEDGDVEDYVQAKYIRLRVSQELYYLLGEKVEVQQVSVSQWMPAVIADTHDDNRYYTVLYDDTDRQDIQIPASRLRRRVADAIKEKPQLRVGDQIEANFNSDGSWYPGRIAAVHNVEDSNSGETAGVVYDIEYDDGDAEKGKSSSEIRPLPRYKMGQKVEARYRGGNDWFPATIVGVTSSNKYHLEFEDGAGEQNIAYSAIREALRFKVGDEIQAQFRGFAEYFDGVVAGADMQAHTYTINYTDGDVETDVVEGLIRMRPDNEGFMASAAIQVRLVHNNQKKWVDGNVIREKDSDSYFVRAIMPNDGAHKIVLATTNDLRYPIDEDSIFAINQRVEARFQMGQLYFAGTITGQHNDDGTYDIQYDDGDNEERVPAKLIRKLKENDFDGVFWNRVDDIFTAICPSGHNTISTNDFVQYCSKRGDLLEPQDENVSRHTQAWWIDFVRGESESEDAITQQTFRQFFNFIASQGGSSSGAELTEDNKNCQAVCRYLSQGIHDDREAQRVLMPGSRIEARYGGFHEWFPGRIVARGSKEQEFHIHYDDGDHEEDVPANLIRFYESDDEDGDDEDEEDDDDEQSDEEVEHDPNTASSLPTTEWTSRLHALFHKIDESLGAQDGVLTFAELKAAIGDGDIASIVIAHVDKFSSKRGRSQESAIDKATWEHFFYFVAAEDLRKHGIAFDSSKPAPVSKSSTAKQLVELLETYVFERTSDAQNTTSKFVVGQAVEARFGGEAEWFPGVIAAKPGSNRYSIRYDDGDFEEDVDSSFIRAIIAQVNDRVEGNYAEAGEWFPGKVSEVHEDGTVDITYDDGDIEMAVAPHLVRFSPGASDDESSEASAPQGPGFGIGEHVEGNFAGQGSWFPGKITVSNSDGTYDILYDDGDAEKSVPSSLIRSAAAFDGDSQSTMPSATAWKIGDKVEGNFANQGSWFPGVVSRVNANSTVDITYDDGDTENDVALSLVRKPLVASGHVEDAGFSSPHEAPFQVGTKVTANYCGQGSWFAGTISRVGGGGVFDIAYNDGDTEQNVPSSRIRKADDASITEPPTDAVSKSVYAVGQVVEGNFAGQGSWFRGSIKSVNDDGTVSIAYEDGDSEENVALDCVRLVSQQYEQGDKVEVNFGGQGSFFPGIISKCNSDGTYDIAYDDGDTEASVAVSFIRAPGGDAGAPGSSGQIEEPGGEDGFDADSQSTRLARSTTFKVGARVECDFAGAGSYFPGKIARVHEDGTYDVEYDDGDSETNVDAVKIRSVGTDSDVGTFREGEQVEANFAGEGQFYKGRIKSINADGTYDITYDDGDVESSVPGSLVRKIPTTDGTSEDFNVATTANDETSDSPKDSSFVVAQRVEANYAGEGQFFPGKIGAVHGNGTYDIVYDDGDEEKAVDKSLIKSVGEQRVAATFRVGDKVEADFGGEGAFFAGAITAIHSDGACDITYDDGDKEERVPAHRIRSLDPDGNSNAPTQIDENAHENDFDKGSVASESLSDGIRGGARFQVGEAVEADYGGEGTHYPGTVERVNEDGTYSIKYSDGDAEDNVPENRIRVATAVAQPNDSESKDQFAVGDNVEADFGGEGTLFPGTIDKVVGDGTYDIKYSDGDHERNVPSARIRRLDVDTNPDEDAHAKFKVGDAVEADYGGEGTFFPGKIDKINADGTYSIVYEDGDEEARVPESLVRPVQPTASTSFEIGDHIEALYNGGDEWFGGTIAGKNADGTYAIDYNDGDHEDDVPATEVRRPEGAKSTWHVNDKVLATADGSAWRPGVVQEVVDDGGYVIQFDDGDDLTVDSQDVKSYHAEPRQESAQSDDDASIMEGDEVTAYDNDSDAMQPATIMSVNDNGSFHVKFNHDGHEDENVDRDDIEL